MRRSFTAAHAAAFRLDRHHLTGSGGHADPRFVAQAFGPARAASQAGLPLSPLRRLGEPRRSSPGTSSSGGGKSCATVPPRPHRAPSLIDVCRDSGGIQAQVMAAAELSLWTRRRATTRADIRAALWERRDLVRTAAMRLTLHVIPTEDFSIYIAAVRPGSRATLDRWIARVGATPAHVESLIRTVMDALTDGPRTQQELIACAKKHAGKRMGVWLDHAWSAVRPAVVDGLICYGPPRGAEATFVRVDRWLTKQKAVDTLDARAELLRRFLAAFGPATSHDFAKWSGLKTTEAKVVLDAIADEAVEVSIAGASGWLLRRDLQALAGSRLDPDAVHLLPAFDSLLLAHATKDHLVEPRFYKRIYRAQGWISPTILQGGRAVGVWFHKVAGKRVALDVQLFGRASPALRDAVEREADALSRFLDAPCTARFTITNRVDG